MKLVPHCRTTLRVMKVTGYWVEADGVTEESFRESEPFKHCFHSLVSVSCPHEFSLLLVQVNRGGNSLNVSLLAAVRSRRWCVQTEYKYETSSV